MSSAPLQPKANATFFPDEIHDLANASPTCLAAQTNIIRLFSESPRGDRVFPVPVGAI